MVKRNFEKNFFWRLTEQETYIPIFVADEAVKRIIIDLIPESKPFFEVMPEYDGERQTVILDPGLVQKAFWEIIQWDKEKIDLNIPQKVREALNEIDNDQRGYLESHYGGVEYHNRPNKKFGETKIPDNNITIYTEYDVNVYKYGKNRGGERIVTGLDGSAWYTPDHYKTWYRMR